MAGSCQILVSRTGGGLQSPGNLQRCTLLQCLLALELTVVEDSEALFTRALAWIVLCMVWGAMRCDDMQSVIPIDPSSPTTG